MLSAPAFSSEMLRNYKLFGCVERQKIGGHVWQREVLRLTPVVPVF
jgi:hypothetical protein